MRREPSVLVWCLASISLVLPAAALGLLVWGLVTVFVRGQAWGWWIVGAAAAVQIADVAIDVLWSSPAVLPTDEPELNQRGQQLVGRVVVLAEPMRNGRGRVRVGDSVWQALGPNLEAGVQVRVVKVDGSLLVVEAA